MAFRRLALIALLCGALPAGAPRVASADDASPVRVRLVTNCKEINRGQRFVLVGVLFDLDPGWRMFWSGRNDHGVPPELTLTAPEGWKVKGPRWPAPDQRVVKDGTLDHVFVDRGEALFKLTAREDGNPGDVDTIRIHAEWSATKDRIAKGSRDLEVVYPFAAGPPVFHEMDVIRVVTGIDERMPHHWGGSDPNLEAEWERDAVEIEAKDAAEMYFYPELGCGPLVDPAKDTAGKGGKLRVRFREVGGQVGPAEGILEVVKKDGSRRIVRLRLGRPGDDPLARGEEEEFD